MLSPRTAYGMIAVAIILASAAQLLIKARFDALQIGHLKEQSLWMLIVQLLGDAGLWVAGVMMISCAVLWYAALTRLPLSFVLPATAIIAPLVSVGAYFLLGEELTLAKSAAILVIATGVAWLGYLQA